MHTFNLNLAIPSHTFETVEKVIALFSAFNVCSSNLFEYFKMRMVAGVVHSLKPVYFLLSFVLSNKTT